MTEAVGSVTQRLATMALDAYELRQQAIANNVANINTQGYRPLRVDFETQLASLQKAQHAGAGDDVLGALIDQVTPRVVPRDGEDTAGSSPLRLDDEMASMVQNTIQYEALLSALDRRGALMRLSAGM